MASVIFTQGALSGVQSSSYSPYRLFPSSLSTTFAARRGVLGVVGATSVSATYAPFIVLDVFKGVPPDSFAGLTNTSARASDLLVSFQCGSDVNELIQSTGSHRKFLIGKSMLNTATAVASGEATWFILRAEGDTATSPSNAGDLVNVSALLGTIGVLGSGADVEISDVQIVAGQQYKSAGFLFSIPASYTV